MNEGNEWQALIDLLRDAEYQIGLITPKTPVHRIEFDVGLEDAEVTSIENALCFRFPPDLRAFLQTGLPIGPGFPNWRHDDLRVLRERLDAPVQGVLFDVEHSGVWLDAWGPRPPSSKDAVQHVADLIRAAPRLIPVFGHRVIPDDPPAAGNPVLSAHQTDIICYGFDLEDYLRNEFGLGGRRAWPAQMRPVQFWDLMVE